MEYQNSTIQKIVCVLPSLLQVIWDKKLSGVLKKNQQNPEKLVGGHRSKTSVKMSYLHDTKPISHSFE